jgi:allantoate deiminase
MATAVIGVALELGPPAVSTIGRVGAGHDTQNLARLARIAMVFARSRDGGSLTPAEFTSVEDTVAATRVLAGALYELAY